MIEPPTANSHAALDEEAFTQLLAAAYVMQEHRDSVRAKPSPADLTEIVSQTVETQYEVHSGSLDRDQAFDLIAKRLCSLCRAAGVAIATVEGESLLYRAGTGSAAPIVGSQVRKQASLASLCFETATAFESPQALTDPRLDSERCRKLGAESLLAVPLHQNGQVAGAIEMYFPQVSGFGESETRAAELMAGVASQVMADSADPEMKEELESERRSILQALERLEPELQKVASPDGASSAKTGPELCRACGNVLLGSEISCSVCGAARTDWKYPGAALQAKWAVLWERHVTGAERDGVPWFRKASAEEPAPRVNKLPGDPPPKTGVDEKPPVTREETENAVELLPSNSAAPAEECLSLQQRGNEGTPPLLLLRTRPGDASLILAALVLLITLIWAFWPRHPNASLVTTQVPTAAIGKRRSRPTPPKLTLFEKGLVALGLAIPPPAPEYMGDPNLKVWEDLQTGLYYCPGADLYGATAKGDYRTQAQAQQDAFEPAFRKPCD